MLEIRERDFTAFFETPFAIYGNDVPYASPMRGDLRKALSSTNPLFADGGRFTYFTALRAGRPVGRIVAHEHQASNAKFGTSRASFGFFDCEDDPETAAALLGRTEDWARSCDFSELVGNFNLTAMQQMGVQTDGFDRTGFTDMVVNPPHTARLLQANGFAPFFPMTTFEVALDTAQVPEAPLASGFTFAPITRSTFKERMEDARLVLNDGFAQNPFFVPLTAQEFRFQAGELSTIMDPRLSSVVSCEGQPTGVLVCIPDLNGFLIATHSRLSWSTPFHFLRHRLRRRRAVIIFYAVARTFHGRGLMSALLRHTLRQAREAGYERLGVTWIADENAASLRMMEKVGGYPLHRLHLFRKSLA